MGLFDRLLKKEEIEYTNNDIVALANARVVPLSEVKDLMFKEEMMGQTLAFELYDSTIVSPINGTLEVMYPTGHAFAVKSETGLGILVHIGIDTARLKGKGFKVLAKQGDTVKANQKLIEVDTSFIQEAGYDATVFMIVTKSYDDSRIPFNLSSSIKKGQILYTR